MSTRVEEDNPLVSIASDKRWLLGAAFHRRATHYAEIEWAAKWRADWQAVLSSLEGAWKKALASERPIPTTTVESLLVGLREATPDLSSCITPPYGDASFCIMLIGCVMIVSLQACVDGSEQPLDELWSLGEQLPYHVRSLVDEDNPPSQADIERELDWIRLLPSLLDQKLKPTQLVAELSAHFPAWHLVP